MLAGAIVRTVAPADVALRSPHRAELRIERNTDRCHVITSLSMPPRFMIGGRSTSVTGPAGWRPTHPVRAISGPKRHCSACARKNDVSRIRVTIATASESAGIRQAVGRVEAKP
jgi:hypothetical protein